MGEEPTCELAQVTERVLKGKEGGGVCVSMAEPVMCSS